MVKIGATWTGTFSEKMVKIEATFAGRFPETMAKIGATVAPGVRVREFRAEIKHSSILAEALC